MNCRIGCAIVCLLAFSAGCNRTEKIKLEPTDESSPTLSSVLRMNDPGAGIQLLKGFHETEHNAWRWTMGNFSVTLRTPEDALKKGARLTARFSLPDAAISRIHETTLTARLQETTVGSQTYAKGGDHVFTADIPPAVLHPEATTVDFSLSKFIAAGTLDNRELGVVISLISLESK